MAESTLGSHKTKAALPLVSARGIHHDFERILGTAAHMWDVDVAAAIALLAGNSINTKPLLTDVIALDEVVTKGFDRLLTDKNVFKIVVDTTR